MRLIDVYTETIANWFSGGNLINRDKISSIGIKPAFDRILTKQYIRKVWCLASFPVEYSPNATQMIRSEMFLKCPNCKTIIQLYNTPVSVNINGDAFKRQMGSASTQFEQYKEAFSTLDGAEQLTGRSIKTANGKKFYIRATDLQRIKDKYNSYAYVFTHKQRGGTFTKTYFFVEALCPTRKDMRNYKKAFTELMHQNQIYFKEVKGNIGSFLNNFGAATYIHENVGKFPNMLFSDENLSGNTPYNTRGLVGGSGLLFGIDWKTKLPFLLNPFKSSAGQVCMLLGKTGSGKTYIAFQIALSLLAEEVHCSAICIKGGEWERLQALKKTAVISMDDVKPRFVNTLRLDDISCTDDEALDYYNLAIRGTVQLLALMVNLQPNEGNESDLNMLLEEAVTKLYAKNDISPNNRKSFIKSRGLKFSDVIDILSDQENTVSSYNDQQRNIINMARTRCSMYVQNEGRFAHLFKNEITVGEILDTPLVVYSFNKNSGAMLDTLDTLKVFMVQFLDTKKQAIRKSQGLHTAAFYEELQRCDQFGKLLTYISHTVTGSRSNNVIVFLLLNALTAFNNGDMGQIKSNITTKIVGKLNQEDINIMCNQYDCEDMRKPLEAIKKGGYYENCFAIKYDLGNETDQTVYKVIFPEKLEKLFRTRDIKND